MTVVNERVLIRDDAIADWRVVLVTGVVFGSYSHDDAVAERFTCVQLRMSELASEQEIVDAFGHVGATQRRWEQQYRDQGLEGLSASLPRERRSTKPRGVEDAVVVLHAAGLSMRRISERLGLALRQVAAVYKRRSLEPHESKQQTEFLPGFGPEGFTMDEDQS